MSNNTSAININVDSSVKKETMKIENRDILETAISLRRKLHFPCKHGKAVVN